jgi:AcrR family transcriptional regulator
MRESSKKDQTRARILSGAARAFRGLGYGGAGVDGVAKAAGVTSGAFYANFKSKAEAFKHTVVAGMRDLNSAVGQLREQHGSKWVDRFVTFYVSDRRTCPLTESCALQSLTGDVSRADEDTREAFELELRALLATTADGLPGTPKERRTQAIAMLAMLSGGVSLARAVNDPALSEEIGAAVRSTLLKRR